MCRDAADQLDEVAGPGTTFTAAWENRRFLQRAVACLAGAGIDRFLDLGAGLPTQGNVHEIAQRVNPAARVAYVDNDPIVLSHGRALLADDRTTRVFAADMREPEAILTAPGLAELIDFSRPVAVLFVAVLHFVRDDEDPYGIVGTFRDAMAPGSYLVLSHVTTDGPSAELLARNQEVYERATSPSRPPRAARSDHPEHHRRCDGTRQRLELDRNPLADPDLRRLDPDQSAREAHRFGQVDQCHHVRQQMSERRDTRVPDDDVAVDLAGP
jgi:SAM-dependent methyltransferase